MDTYSVVIPSPAFRIIFHLLHFDKKDIGENAVIAIESLNLCSFRITIRLRYPAQISGPDIREIIEFTIRLFLVYTGLSLIPIFMNAHAPRPNMLEVIVSGRL